MNKPISIAINDTKNSIISSINESGLPACILLEILNSLVSQINELAKQELASDTKQYIEDMKKREDAKKKEKKTTAENIVDGPTIVKTED